MCKVNLHLRLCRQSFGGGGMVNGSQVLDSAQQHEVNAALSGILGATASPATQEAFPSADGDMQALTEQLDQRIAPDGQPHILYTFLP